MSLTDLQNKIEQKLGMICASLDTLKEQQKALVENADKVKSSLHVFEMQVSSLRRRERQLIRQVDVVTAHQKSLIDGQIARLMHTKGSLITTQEILTHFNPDNVESLSKIIEENLTGSVQPIRPLKMISVQLDTNPLSSAVGAFGSVHLPDTITHEQSAVIPTKVEDYGDSEHDVLHKSIGNSSSIKIQFPKLPQNGWLASPCQKNSPPLLERKHCKMSSWLSTTQNPTLTKSLDLFENHYLDDAPSTLSSSFDVPSTVSLSSEVKRSRHSSIGSSIEIINCEEIEKGSCCSMQNEEESRSCWLSPTSRPSSECLHYDEGPVLVDEEFACQANEPCRSYDECLCDGYCEKVAKERAAQNSRWLLKAGAKRKFSLEGRGEVLSHMSSIMGSSSEKWLAPESRSKVLKQESESNLESIVPGSPAKPWLAARLSPTPEESSSQTSHSYLWLLRRYKEELRMRQDPKVESKIDFPNGDSFVTDMKRALPDLSFCQKFSANGSPASNPLLLQALRQDDSTSKELQKKLKWLCNPRAHDSLSAPFLPDSLKALVDSNLDK